jgi:hypothetical protein
VVPALVFFGVATLFGLLIRGMVQLRLRSAAGQADSSDEDLCKIKQAQGITSLALLASLVGLIVVGLALVAF